MNYDFNVSINPRGVCPAKLGRDIKDAFGLPRKPKIIYVGRRAEGTDNVIEGTLTVVAPRVLNAAEIATLTATITNHDPCPPVGNADLDEVGIDRDDLEDLFTTSVPGQIVYVRDLPRINGESATRGTLVYRTKNGWRRVSNDQVVVP